MAKIESKLTNGPKLKNVPKLNNEPKSKMGQILGIGQNQQINWGVW